jgi:hypothetical protein
MPDRIPAPFLAWVLLQAAGVVLLLGGVLPFPLPWLQPGAWFAGAAAALAGLALILASSSGPALPAGARGASAALLQGLLLAFLALPLLAPGARISRAGAGDLAVALAGIAGLGTLGSGLRSWTRDRLRLAAAAQAGVLASILLPAWFAFLGRAHGAADLSGLVWISPVWAAAQGGAPALGQGIAAALLGAALAAGARRAA